MLATQAVLDRRSNERSWTADQTTNGPGPQILSGPWYMNSGVPEFRGDDRHADHFSCQTLQPESLGFHMPRRKRRGPPSNRRWASWLPVGQAEGSRRSLLWTFSLRFLT